MRILGIVLAGGLGSLCRYLIATWGNSLGARMPYGTLAVNLAGCFAIGLLGAMFLKRPDQETLRIMLVTGFLGGFTTFSAYSWETMALFRQGETEHALAYITASNVGGLVAAWSGYRLGSY